MNIKELLAAEAAAINNMLKKNSIYAKVDPAQSIYNDPTAGFIRYALKLRHDQQFSRIERIQRELSVVLSAQRRQWSLPVVQALPVSAPVFGIEVQHPEPKTLQWSPRLLDRTPAHTMLLGCSYETGATQEFFAFDASVHCLVAGITKAGKSVLLQNMLLSLCYNTSPAELRIVMVDLKNEDMVPFEHLPHIMRFCGTRDQAMNAIQFVVNEKDKRVSNRGYKPYRLVLWVDELAQLADNKEARQALGDLASIGRSKDINLVGATQHPTEAGGLGTMLKANFPLRLVGMVANGQSHIATGRSQLHAELLPGKGSFLRIEGPDVIRFQSFNLDKPSLEFGVNLVMQKWSKASPMPSQRHTDAPKRDAIDDLADIVGPLKAQFMSKRAICLQVLGKEYAGSYAVKIDAALKRYKERQSATTEAATTPLLPASYTSESAIAVSSSSDDEKIIRLPKRAANG